jgi:hypothetical protein
MGHLSANHISSHLHKSSKSFSIIHNLGQSCYTYMKIKIGTIERRGVAKYKKLQTNHGFDLERFTGVAGKDTEASDHCPVYIEIEI